MCKKVKIKEHIQRLGNSSKELNSMWMHRVVQREVLKFSPYVMISRLVRLTGINSQICPCPCAHCVPQSTHSAFSMAVSIISGNFLNCCMISLPNDCSKDLTYKLINVASFVWGVEQVKSVNSYFQCQE